jgi:hypothetical protein
METKRFKKTDAEKERCVLCNEVENVVHILLKRDETYRWGEQFLDNKFLK